MTVIDFLVSPAGQELTHAFVVLIVAVAGLITWLTRRQVKDNATKLNHHLNEHLLGDAHTTSGETDDLPHNI